MPPGWKPGDSINLDGLANMFEGGPVAGLQPPVMPLPSRPPVGPKPQEQEPIQVQHVQLDIGNDDSDEYSSDVGSSEEDDEE